MDEIRAVSSYYLLESVRRMLEQKYLFFDEYGYVDWALSSDYWFVDFVSFSDGSMSAVYMLNGVLYSVDINFDGEMISLSEPSSLFSEDRSSPFYIIRSIDDEYRVFLIAGSSVLNRIGVFDTRSLFDDFENNFDPINPPYMTIAHEGRALEVGTIEWVSRFENTLVAIGKFNKSKLSELLIRSLQDDPDWWGLSVGFEKPTTRLTRSGSDYTLMYVKGILNEISFLQETDVAHFFTQALLV